MALDNAEYLSARLKKDPQPPADLSGSSGYFSTPSPGFDPRLLDRHKHFKASVRTALLKLLYDFWEARYERPRAWSTVWVAGSAISHQWAADRGNGDLDVLIGVDHAKFLQYNADFQGIPESVIDQRFNMEFYQGLDKATAHWSRPNWGGTWFEVTFYVNPKATDIRDIHPYAAYNLTDDDWTVTPPELPRDWDPRRDLPTSWWPALDAEVGHAKELVERYRAQARQMAKAPTHSPARVNAGRALQTTAEQAAALFDDIHTGRKHAFGSQGDGYYDYYNARWQSHKNAGTVDALRSIKVTLANATLDINRDKYGTQVLGADQAMTEASLWNSPFREQVSILVPKEQQ